MPGERKIGEERKREAIRLRNREILKTGKNEREKKKTKNSQNQTDQNTGKKETWKTSEREAERKAGWRHGSQGAGGSF